ncbi:acyl-CoA N-acyltransferase [Geopyxis carbonaria]|nr:acyl-CoA N-acyltransferase [Geopyxis carbonaria]
MPTSTLFLSDSSLVTTVSPAPSLIGHSFFSHSHPPTRQQYSKWTVSLTSSHPSPPSTQSDIITIVDATTADGQPHPDPVHVLYATLSWYFHLPPPSPPPGTRPGAPRLEWVVQIDRTGLFSREESLAAAEQAGLITLFDGVPGDSLVPRAVRRAFWQISYPFMKLPSPLLYVTSLGVRHPIRPRPARKLYRRHVPSVGAILSFRLARLDDAPTVNSWMNNPRVAAFWGEEGDIAKTERFLQEGLEKRHSFPVIGCWEDVVLRDGKIVESGTEEPFGYFEVYWVKEDALARHCDAGDWERGIHVLVGEERFRGEKRLRGWLGGLVHYCFLDDPRTMTVTLEPRVDNEKFIRYLMSEGFSKEKEFAFPHKQAALMRLHREAWEGPAA